MNLGGGWLLRMASSLPHETQQVLREALQVRAGPKTGGSIFYSDRLERLQGHHNPSDLSHNTSQKGAKLTQPQGNIAYFPEATN